MSDDPQQQTRPETPSATPEVATVEGGEGVQAIHARVIAALRTVFDPEIPVNIYELGLIYDVLVSDDGSTHVRMTLTTPNCPAAEELPPEIETKVRSTQGVTSVQLDLVWEPPWAPEMMSDAAKLELGMF